MSACPRRLRDVALKPRINKDGLWKRDWMPDMHRIECPLVFSSGDPGSTRQVFPELGVCVRHSDADIVRRSMDRRKILQQSVADDGVHCWYVIVEIC